MNIKLYKYRPNTALIQGVPRELQLNLEEHGKPKNEYISPKIFLCLQLIFLIIKATCAHVCACVACARRSSQAVPPPKRSTKWKPSHGPLVLEFDQTGKLILHKFFCSNVIATNYHQRMLMLGVIFFVLENMQ